MGIVVLDPMFLIVGGQWVEISEIRLASRTLTDDQLSGLVDNNHVRGIVGKAVAQEQSVPGMRMRLMEGGAIVLHKDLFLLKNQAKVRYHYQQ